MNRRKRRGRLPDSSPKLPPCLSKDGETRTGHPPGKDLLSSFDVITIVITESGAIMVELKVRKFGELAGSGTTKRSNSPPEYQRR